MLLVFDGAEWEPAAVCVCVCVSLSFCGKNLTPIPTQQTAQHFLLSPPLLLPHYVLFTPLEAAQLSFPLLFFLLFHRPTLTWLQYVSLHPTAVFIIPAFASIPFRERLFCLERQKKTVMWKTPPTGDPDGSQSLHMDQRCATHAKFRDIQLHKAASCYENKIIFLLRTPE